ncbi:hypothetical protein TMSI_42370 [Klebsiella quasipneumoniae]|nr:hypothetical protein TMSI_42370 [Klebsiella quasipneumoniae]
MKHIKLARRQNGTLGICVLGPTLVMFAVQLPLWSSYGKVKLPSKGDPQMTITAYSRKFKRELDAKQLENLFERS